MTRAQYEAKYGASPVAASSGPVKMTRAEYEAKYATKAPTYTAQASPEQRAAKIGNLQAEATQAEAESKRANSFGGKLGAFGGAFVKNIAGSEVGLGQTFGQSLASGKVEKQLSEANKLTADVKVNLIKLIRENKAAGKDTTKLEQAYNQTYGEKAPIASFTDILPATQKTNAQVIGEIGGTALDALTAGTYGKAATGMKAGTLAPKASTIATKASTTMGLPELGKVSQQKTSGLFTKKGLGNVAKGTGIGYAYDVSQGLQGARGEDKMGVNAFNPGAGTALGFGIPVVAETVQSIKNVSNPLNKVNKIVTKREKALNKLDSLQTVKKAVEKGRERGIDVKKIVAETDVLSGAVDDTGTITTKGNGGAIEQYTKQFIDGNEAIIGNALEKEGRSISPALVKRKLTDAVIKSGIEGKELSKALSQIDDEVAGYMLRATPNGTIPVKTLHNAKIDKYNGINFFTDGSVKKYDKTIAKSLKELVESNTTSIDVAATNKELSKHFAVIDYLNRLDGRKVSGGKLGKYFAQTLGGIIGSKGGPIGAIVGAELGGRIKGEAMARTFSGKTGKVFPQAKAIEEAAQYIKSEPLQLPQSRSNSLGSRKTSQSTTIIPTNMGISKDIPRVKSASSKLSTAKKNIKENGQAGFAQILKPKDVEKIKDAVSKELYNFDTKVLTVNGAPDLSKSDRDFRIMQLQEAVNKRALTNKEVEEALLLLKSAGVKFNSMGKAELGLISKLGLASLGVAGALQAKKKVSEK